MDVPGLISRGKKTQPLISRGFFIMFEKKDIPQLDHTPPIILVADFGDRSASAQCKLAMERAFRESSTSGTSSPNLIEVDDLVPFDIIGGGFALYRVSKQAPKGSIFVTVVDPGVGTDRKIIAVTTKHDKKYIGPNNGVLWPAIRREGVESVYIVDPSQFTNVTSTFHGRDIMSPLAGLVASGKSIKDFGQPADETILERLRVPYGRVLWIDPNYGNVKVWAGVPDAASGLQFRNGHVSGHCVPVVQTFGDVEIGNPLGYRGSDDGLLEIAVREGSAREMFDIPQHAQLDLHWY